MTPHVTHDLDELSDLLDDRHPEGRRRQVEERVRACDECRAALEAMRWAREQAARLARPPEVPDLDARVRDVLAREDARSAGRRGPARALWLAAALLLLGLAGTVVLRHRGPAVVAAPDAVATEYRAYRDGRLSLALVTDEPSQLEAYFVKRGLGFPTRVLDLGMMGYTLEGGREGRVAGGQSAFFVYRGPSGEVVICQMFRGRLAHLPPPVARRAHDGIPFQVYERDGLTLVFWPEGDVLCVLVGSGDSETVVQLAFAKAMKASGAVHDALPGEPLSPALHPRPGAGRLHTQEGT